MQTLQKAFSQLHLVARSAALNAAAGSRSQALTAHTLSGTSHQPGVIISPVSRVCVQWSSSSSSSSSSSRFPDKEGKVKAKSFDPPSPYRTPGPRRYGYNPSFFTDGLLPRGEDLGPVKSLKNYKVKDSWNRKRSLYGQNDYIDLLGDGSIKPVDLVHGPDWLIGFKGNELQRLVRRLNFQGDKIKHLYPDKYHNIQKRIFFLYKKYNQKRGKRVGSQKK